jgi:hypothetical protein
MEIALMDLGFNPKFIGYNRLIKLVKLKQKGKCATIQKGYAIIAKEEGTTSANVGSSIERCIKYSDSQYNGSTVTETICALALLFQKETGLYLDNIRIIQDSGCYSYEIFKKTVNPFTDKITERWKKVDKYFSSLEDVLNHLQELLLKRQLTLDEYTPKEFIEVIGRVKKALAKIIIIKEVEEHVE